MNRHGISLAEGTFLALLAATTMLTPVAVSAQSIAPGEPSARAPIAIAQNSAEAKSNIDKLVPVPEAANVPPPTAADIKGVTPLAPAVTVVPPTPNLVPATAEATPLDSGTPAVTPVQPEQQAAPMPAYTGKDLVKAPIATSLSTADAAIAEKLRGLLADKSGRYLDRKNERDAVEAFYRNRGFAPLWIDNGAGNARAASTVAYLKGVDADGLEPSEYTAPELKAGLDPDALADADLKLTVAALAYARHAATGRVSFTRISNDIYYDLAFPDPSDVLAKLAATGDTKDMLASYLPQHPAYQALKAKYAEARAKTGETAPARIPNGQALKLAKVLMQDPRVPLIRERLGVAAEDNTAYNQALADAVKKYQADKKLGGNGVLNQATIDSINGPRRDRDADIILANLERWRWLPHVLGNAQLGDAYVMVNIPDFTLKIVHEGSTYWTTKIVTGKPGMPTPMISPDMKFITVNPTWNVPPSIIANEYLPVVRQDPTALERIGLRMENNKDGTVRIYQPPGERNALGRVRFNFPNKYLVYQHDTPDKNLFAESKRAFSHGCMRVENPIVYAEKLLSIELPKDGYTQDKIHKMFGNNEVNIDFPKPLPVHITYQTAFVGDDGKLEIREDIYGTDARVLQALKTDERKVADIAIEQHGVGSATVSRDALRFAVPDGRFENPFASFFQGFQARDDSRDRKNKGREARQDNNRGFFGLFR
jgi:murein L,D-transpeptidase YcbB/YkuD